MVSEYAWTFGDIAARSGELAGPHQNGHCAFVLKWSDTNRSRCRRTTVVAQALRVGLSITAQNLDDGGWR